MSPNFPDPQASAHPWTLDPDWDYNDSDIENSDANSSSSSDSSYDSDISNESLQPRDEFDQASNSIFTRVTPFGGDRRQNPPLLYNGLPAGISDTVPTIYAPKDAFKIFLNHDIMQYVVNNTNAKAKVVLGQDLKKKMNGIYWRNLNVDELYVFLALSFIMAMNHKPRVNDYWTHDPLFGSPAIFCKEVMSRNRWKNIFKFLRWTHPEEVTNNPQTRIEPFLDKLRERCRSAVSPGRDVSIDESLILYKGRLHFKQFIRTKRSRFGIKVFFLCPGHPNWQGYSWDFQVYYGEGTNFYTPDNPGHLSKSEEIVVKLMSGLLGCGRHVITDNWYTSLRLARFLLEMNTDLTGTINPHRGVPVPLREEALKRRNSAFMRSGDVLVCKYEDKKSVYSLTTRYQAEVVEKTKKFFKGRQFFKLPQQLYWYNEYMGNVDKADQVLSPYSWKRKCMAWFKKLGMHFIFRMINNAFILYTNQYPQYRKAFYDFIKDVVDGLIRDHSPNGRKMLNAYYQANPKPAPRVRKGPQQRSRRPARRAPPLISSTDVSGDDQPTIPIRVEIDRRRRRQEKRVAAVAERDARIEQLEREQRARDFVAREHLAREIAARQIPDTPPRATLPPVETPPQTAPQEQPQPPKFHQRVLKSPTAKKKKPYARCKQCSRSNGIRKETRFICQACPGKPALCSPNCFDQFHAALPQLQPQPQPQRLPPRRPSFSPYSPVAGRIRSRREPRHGVIQPQSLQQRLPPRRPSCSPVAGRIRYLAQRAPQHGVSISIPPGPQVAVSQPGPPMAEPQPGPSGVASSQKRAVEGSHQGSSKRIRLEPALRLSDGQYMIPTTDTDDPPSAFSSDDEL